MDQNLTKNTQDTTYVGVGLSNRNLDLPKKLWDAHAGLLHHSMRL